MKSAFAVRFFASLLFCIILSSPAIASAQGFGDFWLSRLGSAFSPITGAQVADGSSSTSPDSGGGGSAPPEIDYCSILISRAQSAFGSACGSSNYDSVADVNKDGFVNVNDLSRLSNSDSSACKEFYASQVNPCSSGTADIALAYFDAAPVTVAVNEAVTLKYTLSNKGSAEARAYRISVEHGDGAGTDTATSDSSVLKAGESVSGSFEISYSGAGTYTITATAHSSSPDSDSSNNKASAVVKVVPAPNQFVDVGVVKLSFFPASPKAGDFVKFSYVVQNLGTVAASGVSVGHLVACAVPSSAPGGGGGGAGSVSASSVQSASGKPVDVVISLKPGESYSSAFFVDTGVAGTFCTASVYAELSADVNTGNNGLEKSFTTVAAENPNAACTDSDGGKNYFVKGVTTDKTTSKADNCHDDGQRLAEYFCTASGVAEQVNYECPGLSCRDGACLKLVPPPVSAESFRRASWQCYDGSTGTQSSDACASSERWKSVAEASCRGRCSSVSGKCGVNSFSVHEPCSGVRNSVPVIVSSEVPSKVQVGVPSTFVWRAFDSDGDVLTWGVEWGDNTAEMQACAAEKVPPEATTSTSAVAQRQTSASSGSSSSSSGGGSSVSNKESWVYKAMHTFSKPGQYTVKVTADECGDGKSSGMASASYLVSVGGEVSQEPSQPIDAKPLQPVQPVQPPVEQSVTSVRPVQEPYQQIPSLPSEVPADAPSEPVFSGSVSMSRGWNLVSKFLFDRVSDVRSDCTSSSVRAAHYYEPVGRRYVALGKDAPRLSGSRYASGGALGSVWVKMAGSCNVAFSLPAGGWLSGDSRLARGWNLVGVVPDFAGLSLNDVAGSCDVRSAFFWDASSKRWERAELFSAGDVGRGLVLRVADECVLGSGGDSPPELPSGGEE